MSIYSYNSRLFTYIKNVSLFFIMIFFTVFSSVPIKFFSGITAFPNISSIIMYYFFIKKRGKPQYVVIFILGILYDIYNNLPVGYTSLVWLISSGLLVFFVRQLYRADVFLIYMRDYIIFDFINMVFGWVIISILYLTRYPFSKFLWQFFIDFIFSMLVIKIINIVENKFKVV